MKPTGAGVATKRRVIAHVTVCVGCCCGNSDKGHPEVPVEWLKNEWRVRRLLKNVQLSISGCIGPCDVANVAKINSPAGEIWLGNLAAFEEYRDLADWASACNQAGQVLPLPRKLEPHRLSLYRSESA
jgi:hypothetical protein